MLDFILVRALFILILGAVAEYFRPEDAPVWATAVFALVAVVAELATLPAVDIVANFESAIAATPEISALTINELDNRPDALL